MIDEDDTEELSSDETDDDLVPSTVEQRRSNRIKYAKPSRFSSVKEEMASLMGRGKALRPPQSKF